MHSLTNYNNRLPTTDIRDMFRDMESTMNQLMRMFDEDSNLKSFSFDNLNNVGFKETEKEYLMSIDLPGVKSSDIDISLEDHFLTISAERTHRYEQDDRESSGSSYKRFSRTLSLPQNCNPDSIETNLEDGVLEIAIQKQEKTNSKKIKVGENQGSIFKRLLGKSKEKDTEG